METQTQYQNIVREYGIWAKSNKPTNLSPGRDAIDFAAHCVSIVVAETSELKKIKAKAVEVRAAQQRYFRTKDKNVLAESKRLEKELDYLLTEKLF